MSDKIDTQQLQDLEIGMNEASTEEAQAEVAESLEAAAPVKRAARVRGKKYVEARGMVDRTTTYSAAQAIELVKATSYSKFDGTIMVHVNLKKELKPFELSLPHSTGQTLRVAIANDEILADLAQEKIEFDVLLTTPQMMPKLAKFARLLGPKGLMPNPKNGTVTTDPESKKASLMGGAITVKPERKAPLLHFRLGKASQSSQELTENLEALLHAVALQATKVTIAATMSPGVKVNFNI